MYIIVNDKSERYDSNIVAFGKGFTFWDGLRWVNNFQKAHVYSDSDKLPEEVDGIKMLELHGVYSIPHDTEMTHAEYQEFMSDKRDSCVYFFSKRKQWERMYS